MRISNCNTMEFWNAIAMNLTDKDSRRTMILHGHKCARLSPIRDSHTNRGLIKG